MSEIAATARSRSSSALRAVVGHERRAGDAVRVAKLAQVRREGVELPLERLRRRSAPNPVVPRRAQLVQQRSSVLSRVADILETLTKPNDSVRIARHPSL